MNSPESRGFLLTEIARQYNRHSRRLAGFVGLTKEERAILGIAEGTEE